MKRLSESVWMDIHKQSVGDLERKEDNVNLLDIQGLYDYFLKHYEYVDLIKDKTLIHKYYFYVPLCMHNGVRLVKYFVKYIKDEGLNEQINKISIDIGSNVYPKLTSYLRSTYKIDDNGGFGSIDIYPKEGVSDNEFAVNTYEDILNFTHSVIVKKRENV